MDTPWTRGAHPPGPSVIPSRGRAWGRTPGGRPLPSPVGSSFPPAWFWAAVSFRLSVVTGGGFTLRVAIRAAFKGSQRVSPVLEVFHGTPRAAQWAGRGPQCEHVWILNTDVATGHRSPGFPNKKRLQGPGWGAPVGTITGFSDEKMEGGCVSRFGASTGPLRPQQPLHMSENRQGPPCLDTKDRGDVGREGLPPPHREDGQGAGVKPEASRRGARESGNPGRGRGNRVGAEWGLTARCVAARSPGGQGTGGDPGSAY